MRELDVGSFWKLLRPAVVARAVAEHEGQRSVCPLGWMMRTSITPPLTAISVAPGRFTHRLIEGAGSFVLAYPRRDLAEATLTTGTTSGRGTNEFARTGLTAVPGCLVVAPLIAECVANLECRLVDRFPTGANRSSSVRSSRRRNVPRSQA